MTKRKSPPHEIVTTDASPKDPFSEYAAEADPPYSLSSLILFDLDNNPHVEKWIAAIHAIDVSNGTDKASLVKLLNSTRDQRDMLLADLLERWILVKPRSRPRRPAYMMSEDDIALASASGAVMDMKEKGMKVGHAMTLVCKERNISRSKLEDFRARRRRSVRNKKK